MSSAFIHTVNKKSVLNEIPSYIMCFLSFPCTYYPICGWLVIPTSYLVCVCWQLYKELSQCYQALVSSEAKLRQSHQDLSSQLAQRDQNILELQAQLQQQQEQIQLQQQQQSQQQQAQQTVLHPSPNRQTNFKVSMIYSTPTKWKVQYIFKYIFFLLPVCLIFHISLCCVCVGMDNTMHVFFSYLINTLEYIPNS